MEEKKTIYRYPTGTYKNRLLELMEENDFSTDDVSEMTGIERSYIYSLSRGQREGKIELWSKICDYFGVSLDYMFGRTDLRKMNRTGKTTWLDHLKAAKLSVTKKTCIRMIAEIDDDTVECLINLLYCLREKNPDPNTPENEEDW